MSIRDAWTRALLALYPREFCERHGRELLDLVRREPRFLVRSIASARRREIGSRMALGAGNGAIIGRILRQIPVGVLRLDGR